MQFNFIYPGSDIALVQLNIGLYCGACAVETIHNSLPLQIFLFHWDMKKCITHQGSANMDGLLIKTSQTRRECNKMMECKEKS